MDSSKTVNVTANLPIEMGKALEKLVAESGITRSHYMRLLVAHAIEKQVVFSLKMETSRTEKAG